MAVTAVVLAVEGVPDGRQFGDVGGGDLLHVEAVQHLFVAQLFLQPPGAVASPWTRDGDGRRRCRTLRCLGNMGTMPSGGDTWNGSDSRCVTVTMYSSNRTYSFRSRNHVGGPQSLVSNLSSQRWTRSCSCLESVLHAASTFLANATKVRHRSSGEGTNEAIERLSRHQSAACGGPPSSSCALPPAAKPQSAAPPRASRRARLLQNPSTNKKKVDNHTTILDRGDVV